MQAVELTSTNRPWGLTISDCSRSRLGAARPAFSSMHPNARFITRLRIHPFPVTKAWRSHPNPSRTRSLSSTAPMVLQGRPCGRVGRRRALPRARLRAPLRGAGRIMVGTIRAMRPGGVRALVAENIALRQQLLVLKAWTEASARPPGRRPPDTCLELLVHQGLETFAGRHRHTAVDTAAVPSCTRAPQVQPAVHIEVSRKAGTEGAVR